MKVWSLIPAQELISLEKNVLTKLHLIVIGSSALALFKKL